VKCESPPCADFEGERPQAKVNAWLQDWADMRCGRVSSAARKAWSLLGETVYKHDSAQIYEHHTGYCPTSMPSGTGWDKQHASELANFYETSKLYEAWRSLIDAASDCERSEAFIFDLVDVGREFLSVEPCWHAYHALVDANSTTVTAANATMNEFFTDLDRLLGSSNGFLLGRWIRDARALAEASGESQHADFLEWNARSQVTTWQPSTHCSSGSGSLSGLSDYANKAWAGLVKGYYDRRMQIYADLKVTMADENAAVSGSAYQGQVMKLACDFQHNTDTLDSEAQGDAVAIADELWHKYSPAGKITMI